MTCTLMTMMTNDTKLAHHGAKIWTDLIVHQLLEINRQKWFLLTNQTKASGFSLQEKQQSVTQIFLKQTAHVNHATVRDSQFSFGIRTTNILSHCTASWYTRGVPKVTKLPTPEKNDGYQNYKTRHRYIRTPNLFITTSAFNLLHAMTSLGPLAWTLVEQCVIKTWLTP